MKILNLTQHVATSEQHAAGVVEPSEHDKVNIRFLLTFDDLPRADDISRQARNLVGIAATYDCDAVMIGGAPFLMHELQLRLARAGMKPVYAFSRRESVEEEREDGSVVKRAVFRHLGFVQPMTRLRLTDQLYPDKAHI